MRWLAEEDQPTKRIAVSFASNIVPEKTLVTTERKSAAHVTRASGAHGALIHSLLHGSEALVMAKHDA